VPKKFFLVLDDVDADVFNSYINTVLQSSLVPTFNIPNPNDPTRVPTCIFLLRLWKLSQRFDNHGICSLAEDALRVHYFKKTSPEHWETMYVTKTEAWIYRQLLAMQRYYTLCKNESIPFEDAFVTACSNCPGQVIAAHFEDLDPDFRADVMKSFAIRVADPKLAKRKRDHEDESETKVSRKRRG
jgi:hypothetical protein